MTLEDLQKRYSVRVYSDDILSEKEINALRASLSEINSYLPGTRFQLVTNDNTPFKGKLGSYGVFKGVNNYIAAVIDTGVSGHDIIAGYAGQKVVMKATMLGLGTCFIGGTYTAENMPVQLRAGEVIRFIIAVGHIGGKDRTFGKLLRSFAHRKKMESEDFFDTERSAVSLQVARQMFPGLNDALEAVACAPSALNARPVRIWVDDRKNIITGTVKDGEFTQIDLGIARFNFEQILPGEFPYTDPAPFTPFSAD